MTDTTCPACGHRIESMITTSPDPSVLEWFRTDPGWLDELSTDEVYGRYLRASGDRPVSRSRFVADLAHFGVEEFLDGDTSMLVRR